MILCARANKCSSPCFICWNCF